MENTRNIQNQDPSLINILLVFNPKTNKIEAVKTVDEKGDLKTVPNTLKNQNQFLKIDKQGDLFSNFFSNFWSQLKNPTLFNFFKSPLNESEKIGKQIQHHLKHPSTEGEEFLNTYKILSPNNNTISKNPVSEKEYQYSADQIDWDMMSKFGLSQEKLEKVKALEPMLKGFKTKDVVPVTINLGSKVTQINARLSLNTNDAGDVVINIHSVRKEPNFNCKFMGHKFTAEDKKKLMGTGNMGRIVDLINPKTGETIPSVISRDRITNELVAYKVENIRIPDEIKGVKLDDGQKQTLRKGKALYLEGMMSSKEEPFSAHLQFNADKKYVEFLFDHTEHNQQSRSVSEIPETFRGKEFNDEQNGKFKAGQNTYLNSNSKGKTNEATKRIKEPLQNTQQSSENKKPQPKQNKYQSQTRGRSI